LSGYPGEEIIVTVASNKNLTNCFMLAGVLAAFAAGCSPEGAGSIKIDDPEAVRAKVSAPSGAPKQPLTPKQAAAKALEDEAAKKHPKLQ
jgi:hypothetical protein